MSEEPQHEDVPREHSEQPAEGDRAQNPADTGTRLRVQIPGRKRTGRTLRAKAGRPASSR